MSDTGLKDTIDGQSKKDEKRPETIEEPKVVLVPQAMVFKPAINPSEEDEEESSGSKSKDLEPSTVDGWPFTKPKWVPSLPLL